MSLTADPNTPIAQEGDRFARLVASLDVPGGHMLVCLLVIIIGAVLSKVGMSKGDDLILMASGALFLAMKAKGAENHDTDAPQHGPRLPAVSEAHLSIDEHMGESK